jgi:iron complex outermembrane receptor protein
VPSAKSTGVDAEFAYRFPGGFDIAATASYNDAKLTSSLRYGSGALVEGLRDGNRLPTVPKFQGSVSVGYEREVMGGLHGFTNLTWQHVGKRYTQISDQEADPSTVQLFRNIGATTVSVLSFPLGLPSYDIVNLRVGVRGEGWEAAAFVNNLGDERARLALDRERGLRARYGFLTNPPRTYGVTLRKEF